MPISLPGLNIKKLKSYADWKLLVFLLLFLDVKLAVKIPAIILIYLLRFDFKFGFKLKNSRLPLFYLAAIAIPAAAMFINKSYLSPQYPVVLLTGIMFWLLCILAIHQVKLSVEMNDAETIHRTILLFFIIDAVFTGFNLASIMWETKAFNPYLYQGNHQKYFINTGDYIKGLTFDISTTNAVLNAMGVIYFLVRKNTVMLFICMAVLLLTASNFINIVLLLMLAVLFVFKSTRNQKSMIMVCIMFVVVFMAKISPQNNQYVQNIFVTTFTKPVYKAYHAPGPVIPVTQQPDRLLSPAQRKEKAARLSLDSISLAAYYKDQKSHPQVINKSIFKTQEGRIFIPPVNINTEPYQSIKTPQAAQLPLIQFIARHKQMLPVSAHAVKIPALPGKALAMIQTLHFYNRHPGKVIFGDGMGNFSSKLAFRATGLGFAGGFPQKYLYINPDFMTNHLDLYLNFFSKQDGLHSLTNSPFSVYDQLLAEYGLAGLLAFIIYYLGFFLKHYKTLTYGLPIVMLIMTVFFIDYWFEQLSVLVFFELMLLLNIKETSAALPAANIKTAGGLVHA